MERSPETFESAQLLACDFDGTIARTFEPSPNNLSVYESYRRAIEKVLGAQATQQYIEDGGHNNRAPEEIVGSLLHEVEKDKLLKKTELVVQTKLGFSLKEIGVHPDGSVWPLATDGFRQCWSDVQEKRQKGIAIDTTVISSGHTAFIEKTFDTWDLPRPDMLITHETLLALGDNLPTEKKVKPAPFMMDIAKNMWIELYGLDAREMPKDEELNSRILYVGDDPEKDGGLAKNSGVEFVHLDNEIPEVAWQTAKHWINLGNIGLKGSNDE